MANPAHFSVSTAILGVCSSVEGSTTTNLAMLDSVENTVTALTQEQKVFSGLRDITLSLETAVRACSLDSPIDTDENISDCLLLAENAAKDYLNIMMAKMQAAFDDPELCGHHECSVTDEYDQTINILSSLHDAVITLRWAVLEHDADSAESSGDPVTTIEEFRARMQA